MSKGKDNSRIPDVIERLFAGRAAITSGEVADAAGVSRQAAHYHLKRLEDRGILLHLGAGRGGRYLRRADRATTFALAGLQEDLIWSAEFRALDDLSPDIFENPRVRPILTWAFTEMLNNAIDHSGGEEVEARWYLTAGQIAFEIEDDGIGALRRMRESRALGSDFEAIGEIAKGKQTSAPERHSGLGIYFTSRMVGRFFLSSGNLTWTVDNRRDDQAVGWLERERQGTLVRCEVDLSTSVRPIEVFDEFSAPDLHGFNKSTVRVSLFGEGDFVSRSEAKRIGAHLEDFNLVELDFSGIEQVGQGFIDELFRVWQLAHPETRLVPINANPAIMSMIASMSPT